MKIEPLPEELLNKVDENQTTLDDFNEEEE